MNIKQFMLNKGIDKDKISHNDFYTKVVDALGYKDILKYLPFSLIEIKKAFKKDIHLNNLDLKKWDEMSGIGMVYNHEWKSMSPYHNHKGLYNIYKKYGINCYSQCDGVCILKQCARLALERENII